MIVSKTNEKLALAFAMHSHCVLQENLAVSERMIEFFLKSYSRLARDRHSRMFHVILSFEINWVHTAVTTCDAAAGQRPWRIPISSKAAERRDTNNSAPIAPFTLTIY